MAWGKISTHLRLFLQRETAGGFVLMAATALALTLANSPWAAPFEQLLHRDLGAGVTRAHAISDGLMSIFFFAVGMELKYEMREGALADRGQKILPLIAALGGVIVPALLYLAITRSQPQLRAGWAIPTATDIAFALGVLRLIGPRTSDGAKAFLLAIAIYDDLAAILIIALVYSAGIALVPILAALGCMGALYLLNRFTRAPLIFYLIAGIALWFSFHAAGIHPTIAGVVTGLAIPLRDAKNHPVLNHVLHRLHPFVAFAIMPLFALANAGIDLREVTGVMAFSSLPLGIALALFMGKQIGIFSATVIATRLGFGALPCERRTLYAIALIAGIGFTMSLFIGQLALDNDHQPLVRLGVLAGSLVSAFAAWIVLRTEPATME